MSCLHDMTQSVPEHLFEAGPAGSPGDTGPTAVDQLDVVPIIVELGLWIVGELDDVPSLRDGLDGKLHRFSSRRTRSIR
jgi:hypothetical protein